jgi:hypothetical protein
MRSEDTCFHFTVFAICDSGMSFPFTA